MNAFIEENNKRIEEQYWIDRRGKIHYYTGLIPDSEIISIHYEIARQINNHSYPEDILIKRGWIKVGCSVRGGNYISKEPTQSQINTLDRLDELNHLRVFDGNTYKSYKEFINE